MSRRVPIWAWVLGLGAVALSLRLAGLGYPRAIVFDEVYYVPFALDYLHGTPNFDAHPPLGKYFIALGIWLGQGPATWLDWPTVEVNGTLVRPIAFRWLNAVVGATVPMLLAAIAWELGSTQPEFKIRKFLSKSDQPSPPGRGRGGSAKANRGVHPIQRLIPYRRFDPPHPPGAPPEEGTGLSQTRVTTPQQRQRFALLAGLLMAMEGLTLVESRLALINIYGLGLGLLGQWAWLRARHSPHPTRWRWMAGIALGAAVNVKWNWAGMWLGLLLWEIGCTRNLGSIAAPKTANLVRANGGSPSELTVISTDFDLHCNQTTPMQSGIANRANNRRANNRRANNRLPLPRDLPWQVAYLGAMPLATYLLLWVPHLALTGESWVGIHRQLWSTHQSIATGASHAYCSPWHSWPLMARPVAYFFERSGQGAVATTIHAMGNPVLWWLSTAAILALALGWLGRQIVVNAEFAKLPPKGAACCAPTTSAVVPFILLNYLTNWLPWVLVSRCTFLYHAMGIVAFSTLALAWLMAKWLGNPRDRPLALVLLGAIALSFVFWLPLYLGIPLSPEALQRRWLLPGWI